jgi:hypothetical protein
MAVEPPVADESSPAPQPLIEGIFWQPDRMTHQPSGNWELLGVDTFVVQSLVTDQTAWFPAQNFKQWDTAPDWNAIHTSPWAKHIIAGLSGYYSEKTGRENIQRVGQESLSVTTEKVPFPASAYYFPIEADPSWQQVSTLREVLNTLPRPLWISVYAGDRKPKDLAIWIATWLPEDVNVFFQDGVGVGTRTPAEAKEIMDDLTLQFGAKRVALIMETFRPNSTHDSFRSAFAWEIINQLEVYRGQRIYAFDGPHYLGPLTVLYIQIWAKLMGWM